MFKKNLKKSEKCNKPSLNPWVILVVDDEPEVHSITRIALSGFRFRDREIKMISAYSGDEARKIIAEQSDIALIYLDVVMETDDAGLKVVEFIRDEMKNPFVRIILRTGQPGSAPEREVIVNYDINDYKEKTSLDSGKLFTSTYAALRSYNDIMSIEQSRKTLDHYRQGLEQVINASANLFEMRSLKLFAEGLLVQLASLLHIDKETLFVRCHGYTVVSQGENNFEVLAATGCENSAASITPEVRSYLDRAIQEQRSIVEGDRFVGYFPSKGKHTNLLYLDGVVNADEVDFKLMEIFSTNVTIAFDNLYLDQELYNTQIEIIDTLGDLVEGRSKETSNHVRRVAHMSRRLGELLGLDTKQCETLYMAAPMHDIGKVAVPDSVLLKPGKLSDEEWMVMKEHAGIGEEILSRSHRPLLMAASIIAGQHHERFDGGGYPVGLQGEDIHIYGRIVALVDVFDALVHNRCYKEAWPLEQVLDLLRHEKGKHFDPLLVDLFIKNIDKMIEVLERFPEIPSEDEQ